MPSETDLLAAIIDAPDDDAPRMVYADWLMEQGDPRGELVSLQCALERFPPRDRRRRALEERSRELLALHKSAWSAPLKERFGATNLRWRRGMVEQLTLDAETLLEKAEQLFEAVPLLNGIKIEQVADRLPRLLEAPWLGRLRTLDLATTGMADEAARAIAGAAGLGQLESLELGSNEVTDQGVTALAASPHLSRLIYLGLETNRVADDGAVALGQTRTLSGLRRLDLTEVNLGKMWDDNDIGPRGGAALATLPLTHLWLSGNPVGDETLEALAAGEGSVKPLELHLAKVGATDAGVSALAASPRMACLRRLDLAANPFTDAGGRALLESPHLGEDLQLNLGRKSAQQQLTPETLEALGSRFSRFSTFGR